mmetsp:Transcript_27625/g.80707  ORF Transcript_27625/g.80707 Transcript_27625/m.80707 type:complete len:303 (+) Transcript_27625:275-1183(+)
MERALLLLAGEEGLGEWGDEEATSLLAWHQQGLGGRGASPRGPCLEDLSNVVPPPLLPALLLVLGTGPRGGLVLTFLGISNVLVVDSCKVQSMAGSIGSGEEGECDSHRSLHGGCGSLLFNGAGVGRPDARDEGMRPGPVAHCAEAPPEPEGEWGGVWVVVGARDWWHAKERPSSHDELRKLAGRNLRVSGLVLGPHVHENGAKWGQHEDPVHLDRLGLLGWQVHWSRGGAGVWSWCVTGLFRTCARRSGVARPLPCPQVNRSRCCPGFKHHQASFGSDRVFLPPPPPPPCCPPLPPPSTTE